MSPERSDKPLRGRTIALAETRELDDLAQLIEQHGGTPLRCPLVRIVDTEDEASVRDWLERLYGGGLDDVILLTGEGVRRLYAFAERQGRAEQFVAALASVRKITRGPKPARALATLGLRPDLPARRPTTDGVIETLQNEDLGGRHVGVQLYGQDPNEKLIEFLRHKGANVFAVAPYRYAAASEEREVVKLLESIRLGRVDAIAFTSAPQVDRVVDVARASGFQMGLPELFGKTLVAAVGPVTAARLRSHGLPVHLELERQFFMKPLVQELARCLQRQRRNESL